MAEQRWELYVDESGDFSNIKDEVVVAGLLVRTEKAGMDGREIAQAVYAELPHIPSPLHASFLKRPSYGIFCYASAKDPKTAHHLRRLPPERAELYEQALQLLGKPAESLLAEMTRKLRSGKSLNMYYKTLLAWEAQLRKESNLFNALRSHQDNDLACVHEIIRRLYTTDAPPSVLLLFAAEEDRASAHKPNQDRYLLLLQTLVERAWQVLQLRTQGNFRLEVKAATRNVYHPQFNAQVPLQTMLGPLNTSLRNAVSSFTFSSPSGVPQHSPYNVQFHSPMSYDHDIPTALVLADFFSNAARNALQRQLQKHKQCLSLAAWRQKITQFIGPWPLFTLPPHTQPPPQPHSHIAAGPDIAEALRQASHATNPTQTFQNDPRTQNVRLWAKEQALSWLP